MARRRSAAQPALVNFVRSASRTALVASVSMASLAATGVLSVASAQDAAQTLPGTQILPGGRWTGARLPTVAQGNNGLVMTIQQEQKAALLDWSKFDVAASEEVRFDQGGADWIALNRIFSADPSRIAGKITAKGQVWLANTNGVVFQGTAQVNTASMLVTTAAVPDSVLNPGGLLDARGRAGGGGWGNVQGLLEGAKADIVIDQGAKLNFKSDDAEVASTAAFLGLNVINKGDINITDGNLVMLAGEEFSLLSSNAGENFNYDFLRGFYGLTSAKATVGNRFNNAAAWDAAMYARADELGLRVVNEGTINAIRSTVLVEGAEIQQNGALTATSGVRQRSGAIMLRSGFGFDDATLIYTGYFDFLGGKLTLGEGSVTQVLPEAGDDASPAAETFTGAKTPRVVLIGSSVEMEKDSVVRAKGGLVTVDGNYAARMVGDFAGNDKGQPGSFIMREGSLIDVSGMAGVKRDVSDNIVEIEIRANELQGSPAQRDGILYGKDVKVDVREGTSIVDWTGALANKNLTAEDRLVDGGDVRIRALSTVQIENGAKIDLSGGSADYAGGWIDVTQLTAADGRVFDIADADANLKYVGLSTAKRYEAGYTEGGDAGSLEILSASQKLFGRIVSDLTIGQRQAAAGVEGVRPRTPTGAIQTPGAERLPRDAEVTLGTGSESLSEYFFDQVFLMSGLEAFTLDAAGGQTVTIDPSKLGADGRLTEGGYSYGVVGDNNNPTFYRLAPGWVMYQNQPVELRQQLADLGYEGEALEALLEPGAALPDGFQRGAVKFFSFIDDDFVSGLGDLTIANKSDAKGYDFFVRDNVSLTMAAGGALSFSATPARIGQNVSLRAAGGDISIFGAYIGDGTTISTAGQWTNDLDSGGRYGGFVDGGKISIQGARFDGNVVLDASGGGWWKQTSPATSRGPGQFELIEGEAGEVAVTRNGVQTGQAVLDRLDIRLDGLAGAGKLTLGGFGDLIIGEEGGEAPEGVLYLSDAKLNAWGLGGLNIDGGIFGHVLSEDIVGRVAAGPILNPNITNPDDPARILLVSGAVITAEVYAAILAANAEAEAYNASRPEGAPFRTLLRNATVMADLDIRDGTKLDLNRTVLRFDSLPANLATDGDLLSVTTRSAQLAHQADGVTLGLAGYGNLDFAETASIKVAVNGAIGLAGAVTDIAGDLTARSGAISLSGSDLGSLHVRDTAFLDARGLALTNRVAGARPGEFWYEGAIHSGGSINVGGGYVVVEKGALLDVSGDAGLLTITAPSRLMAVRTNRLIGGDAGTINVSGASGYLLGDLRGAAGIGENGVRGRAGSLNLSGGGLGQGPGEADLDYIIGSIVGYGLEFYPYETVQDIAAEIYGLPREDFEPIPVRDPVALEAFLRAAFANAAVDTNGYLALDPTLDAAGPRPVIAPYMPLTPEGYTLQTSQAGLVNALALLTTNFAWSNYSQVFGTIRPGATFHIGQAPLAAAAGFDSVDISGAIQVKSDLSLKALRSLTISPVSAAGADVTLEAPIINFSGDAGPEGGFGGSAEGGEFIARAQTINVGYAAFDGFSKVTLEALRSLSGGSKVVRSGVDTWYAGVYAPGELIIRAGQVYPHTGTALGIFSDTSVTFEGTGQGGPAPLSAGGRLVVEAPTINQGGVLAAPFGTIELTGDTVKFLKGGLTTVAADGRTILYGYTIDGSDWYGPRPEGDEGVLLSTPPEKRIVVTGGDVDLQEGAVIDASGGGDVLGLEFVQGPLGATNILSGPGVFAVSAALGADVSLGQKPSTAPREELAVGDVIWLPAFDGNPAGYYTLLPAEYALTPGGYRVTVAAAGAETSGARQTGDGAFILTGHQTAEQGIAFTDQAYTTFRVMSGDRVRERSEFVETSGNAFFSSERFLTGLERSGGVFNDNPRLPLDGGFLTIAARESLQLNGTFSAAGANSSARGGLLDIAGDRIVVASAGTDISDLVAYLRLDPTQLSGVAESLLIGGVRRQGAAGLEIVSGYDVRDDSGAGVGDAIGAQHVVIRNGEADALTGPEILFASTDQILFESGSVVRAVGDGAQADDVIIRPELPLFTTPNYVTLQPEDRGAFVRISNLGDVSISRTNARNDRGDVVIESGARLEATDAVAVNATRNTTLEPGAILKAGVIEAAAGVVSFGDAPGVENGLVLNDAAFAALAGAQTLRLKSFTTFDIYGDVTLATGNNLTLDGAGLVNMDGTSTTNLSAKTLTLANSNAAPITVALTGGQLAISAESVNFDAGVVALNFGRTDIDAKGRMLFTGAGEIRTAGDVGVTAAQVTATSGASHGFEAGGDVAIAAQASPATLTPFQTAGATLDFTGASVSVDLPVLLSSGVFRASATEGDVTLGSRASIDVSGSAIKFYELTEYLSAGGVQLTSEDGNVTLASGSVVNVAGGQTGNAGDLIISAGRGVATLDGELRGQAGANGKGGAFTLQTSTLADFAGLNAKLNDTGFSRSRRFAVINGDVDLTGVTRVDEFELSTGAGSIRVDGSAQVLTNSAKGGRILIASGGDLVIEDGALLDASAKGAGDQRGGSISLQVGDAGSLDVGAAQLQVAGKGAGQPGEIHLRARQIGGDVAVDRYQALVSGGTTTLEAYRVTDLGAGDNVIDSALQAEVVAQAAAFMTAGNLSDIRGRLGQADAAAFRITPGVEIRSGGKLTMVDEWNLADARFDGVPGVLTLRAGGDLSIDANLSDGFKSSQRNWDIGAVTDPNRTITPLTNDESWSYNLVAGADFSQTNVLATVASATGENDVLVNAVVRTGTGDIEIASSGDLTFKPTREYRVDITQDFTGEFNVAVTFPDGTVRNYGATVVDGAYQAEVEDLGRVRFGDSGVFYGYGAVTVEAGGRVFEANYDNDDSRAAFNVYYNDASLYTAGREMAEIDAFQSPTVYGGSDDRGLPISLYRPASFLEKGGDISISVGGRIDGSGDALLGASWYGQRGITQNPDPSGDYEAPFAADYAGYLQQSAFWITPDFFNQSLGALGGGDVTIRAGGTVDNLTIAMPTSVRVSGGRTAGEAKTLHVTGGGDLDMNVGGDLLGGSYWVGKGVATIEVDGRMDKTADPDIENPYFYQPNLGGWRPDRRHQGAVHFIMDDASLKVTTGGDARFGSIRSSTNRGWGDHTWLSYTERTSLEIISSGGDVQFYASTGQSYEPGDILPSKTRFVSISGSVIVGDSVERPAMIGTESRADAYFDILAREDVKFLGMHSTGQNQTFNAPWGPIRGYDAPSFSLGFGDPLDSANVFNPYSACCTAFRYSTNGFGGGGPGYGRQPGTDNVHEGRQEYARIYSLDGDIVSEGGNFIFGYETRIKAGDDIRMPLMEFLNHDPNDVATVQAGGSIYGPNITIYGEGRLWVQAGDEIYTGIGGYGIGIRASEDNDYADYDEDNGADVSVLTGIDQDPEYDAFFEYYLGTEGLSTKPLYLSEYFTFDAIGLGTPRPTYLADGATEVTIYAVDLVNYWNEMNGREPISLESEKDGRPIARGTLVSKISKADYETALAWFAGLEADKKQGLATRILFAELKTAGREAVASSRDTDPSQTRFGNPTRGYDAVGRLFPGAQRKPGEAKQEGEARWFGDLIMKQEQIRTDGGGDIEILAPGGFVQLATLSVANTDPNTAGVLSQDGGGVNVLTYGDYIVNQSRTMTADDGDILIWSSYGNIDAGKGRKTSLSIPPIIFPVDINSILRVVRSGLPNGAGIATLNRVDGTPGGDVDLYAFNGIVNAGDAGIRASRDLFVGALEIRGLDNITVGGVTNVELNTEEAELGAINLENFAQAAEDEALEQAFELSAEVEKLRTVTQTILTGSVVSFGEEPEDKDDEEN